MHDLNAGGMIHFLKVVPPSVSTFSEGALGWWCCDARLANRQGKPAMTRSAKLERLIDMVGELAAEWRKIIVFWQFASMPDLIRPRLEASGIADEVVKDKKRDVAESLIDRDAHPTLVVTEAASFLCIDCPQNRLSDHRGRSSTGAKSSRSSAARAW